jgi:hypothetical protein
MFVQVWRIPATQHAFAFDPYRRLVLISETVRPAANDAVLPENNANIAPAHVSSVATSV